MGMKSRVPSPATLTDTKTDSREGAGEHNFPADMWRQERVCGKQCMRKDRKGLQVPRKTHFHDMGTDAICFFPLSSLFSTWGRNRLLLWYFALELEIGCVLISSSRNVLGNDPPMCSYTYTHKHMHVLSWSHLNNLASHPFTTSPLLLFSNGVCLRLSYWET